MSYIRLPRSRVLRCLRHSYLFAFALMACQDPAEHAAWSSKYLSIFGDTDTEQLCEGSLTQLDRFVEQAFDFLGENVPTDFNVKVRITNDLPCSSALGNACFRVKDRTIYMESLRLGDEVRPLSTLRHEIVHAVAYAAWGSSTPFFQEGLAEALADRGVNPVNVTPSPVVGSFNLASSQLDYVSVALFSRYLIDAYGMAKYKALYVAAGDGLDMSADSIFAGVLGNDASTVEAEYLDGSMRCLYQLDTCDSDAAVTVAEKWAATVPFGCQESGFQGVSESVSASPTLPLMSTNFVLNAEMSMRYRIQSALPLRLVRCGTCEEQLVRYETPIFSVTDAEVDMPAGMYSLEFSLASEGQGSLNVELVAVSSLP